MEEHDLAWHLKKEISVGHIISTVMLAILLIAGWVEIQNRLQAVETEIASHVSLPAHSESERRLDFIESSLAQIHVTDTAIQQRLVDIQNEILRRLDRQDIKLDRIEDRLNDGTEAK